MKSARFRLNQKNRAEIERKLAPFLFFPFAGFKEGLSKLRE